MDKQLWPFKTLENELAESSITELQDSVFETSDFE